jgi:hypothetical protein
LDDIVIDITGDQYNVISTSKLNEDRKKQAFVPVHIAHINDSYLYDLFRIQGNSV